MSETNGNSSRNNNQRRGGGGSGGGKNSGGRGGGGGRRGGARGGSAQNNRGKENKAPVRQRYESEMSEGDGDRCTVCLYQIDIYAVGECDHFVCHRCATRMRVLCLRNECAICRRDLPKIILMRENKKYELMKNEILPMDQKFKICFETEKIEDEYARLLGNECNMCEEKQTFRNFLQMKKHMNMEHKRFYCDLCVDNLKIFSHERKHYDKQGLTDHRTKGDKEDTSFKGHPLCEYCGIRFLDNDELFKHLRKDHYFCHFCDADGNQYFFSEYKDLRHHFKKDHYLCEDPECEEQKFVVFRSELDFKAHKLEKHSDTKSAFKQNRRVDLEFSFNRREGREERGGGGGFSSRDVREERTRRYEEEREASPAVQVQETVPDLVADFPSLGASQPPTVKGPGNQAKKLAKSTGQNVSGGASWSGMSGGAPASIEEYPSLPGAKAAAAVNVPVQSYRPNVKKNKQESGKSKPVVNTEQFPGLPGFSAAAPASVPVQAYRPQAKKTKPESGKSSSGGGGAKLGGGDQFPGLPAPSKKPVSNIRGATASGPTYRPSIAPANTLMTRTHRAPSKPSPQPTTKTQPTKQRYFDPFDDDSGDDFSYGGDTPAGLDHSSSRAIKHSGQGMDYTSKETSSNIKSIDKSVLEALKGARISERSAPAPIKPVLVSSNQEFPGLGSSGSSSSDKKTKKGKQGKGKGGLDFSNILGGVESQKSNNKAKSTILAASSRPAPAPASPAKINWFAESLTVRPSKQKNSNNNQKQEKSVTPPTSDDFPSFDLKSRGPGHAFIPADAEIIQPSHASNKSQWNKKGDLIEQKEPNGSGGHWSDGCSSSTSPQGASPTRNLSPEKQRSNSNKNYVFDPPADFQERNTALISTVSEVLGFKSVEFKKFREMSVKFRSGELSCKQYFKTCSELLQDTTFVSIFSELMVLLPDINKQQELYSEFLNKYPTERSKVCHCDICRQVLLSDDFVLHRSSHQNDEEFPVLG